MSVFKKLTGSKSDENASSQEFQCIIRFLDESDPMQVTYKKDTIGQWLVEQVCRKLNLVEKDYFGLRYIDNEKQRHWLDPLKIIQKQIKGGGSHVLSFRVKFYPDDPMKLREELTRYFLFLQLRRDLQHGRLLCSPSDANNLAAFIIQSEVGEYDPEDHPPGYVAEFKMLPKQTEQMEEKIGEIHKTLAGQTPSDAECEFLKKASSLGTYGVDPHQVRDTKGTQLYLGMGSNILLSTKIVSKQLYLGQTPSDAECEFLKKASSLGTYGVDPHQVRDTKGTQLYLGITHQGILTFQGNRKTHQFKWNQIRRIAYEGKMFIVHVFMREMDDDTANEKKHHTIGFKCPTVNACRYLWKCAVEQQFFFTLQASNEAPKVRSNKHFFVRGSKFRFSGRCLKEVYAASDNIGRDEPLFTRSASHPTLSRHSSMKHSPPHNTSMPPEKITEAKRKKQFRENAVDVPKAMVTVDTPRPDPDKPPPPDVVIIPATPFTPLDTEPRFDTPPQQAPDITMTTPSSPTMILDDSPKVFLSDDTPELTTPVEEPIAKEERKDLDSQLADLEKQWVKMQSQITNHHPHETNHVSPVKSTKSPSIAGTMFRSIMTVVLFTLFVLVVSLIVAWYFEVTNPYLDIVKGHVGDAVSGVTRSVRRIFRS